MGDTLRIFVSWSGAYSNAVAVLLREWVPNVIQEADVYVSSQDIAKGEAWPDSVRGKLSEMDLGIVVVTKANLEAPWILFEAGALSKSVKSRMIPLLCDLEHVALSKSPLRLFQASLVNKGDIFAMLQSLNSFADAPLSEERLNVSFEKWWPDFEVRFNQLVPDVAKGTKSAKGHDDSVVVDALEALMMDMQSLKAQLGRNQGRHVAAQVESVLAKYALELPDRFFEEILSIISPYQQKMLSLNNSRKVFLTERLSNSALSSGGSDAPQGE